MKIIKFCNRLLLIFTLVACSQTKSKLKIKNDLKIMKIDSYISNLIKNVEHFGEEKTFNLDVWVTKSNYKIQINDLPVEECFDYENNQHIFRSYQSVNSVLKIGSKQKVSFKIWPLDRKTFLSTDKIKITIEEIDQTGELSDFFIYNPPMLDDGETPEYVGKESYSGSFEFEATLPYKKEVDWFKSEDLRNSPNIQQEVLVAYKEIGRLYESGDFETLLQLYDPIFKTEAQSTFATKERLDYLNVPDRIYPFLYKSKVVLDPNYEIKFYADGTLVALKTKTSERNYSKSPLTIRYDKDFDLLPESANVNSKELKLNLSGTIPKKEMELYLFFYKPKGSNTLKLATDVFREEELLNPIED